jgi:hypothetical protein
MAPTEIRDRRRTLRYRQLLVRQMVQMKNRISGLLLETGVSHNKQRLHKVKYFRELISSNEEVHENIRPLLRLSRETIVRCQNTEYALVSSLERDPLLAERIKRLRTVPGVGPITALTWALEIGDVSRFRSIKQAISYCGLCGDEKSSADKVLRTPLSKQRNKHIQSVLIEAAKLNTSPYSGSIHRGMKVNKEEILGMLVALESYLKRDHASEWKEWERRVAVIAAAAKTVEGVSAELWVPPIASHMPHVKVRWDRKNVSRSVKEVMTELSEGDPPIEANPDSTEELVLAVFSLRPGEDKIVAARLRAILKGASA